MLQPCNPSQLSASSRHCQLQLVKACHEASYSTEGTDLVFCFLPFNRSIESAFTSLTIERCSVQLVAQGRLAHAPSKPRTFRLACSGRDVMERSITLQDNLDHHELTIKFATIPLPHLFTRSYTFYIVPTARSVSTHISPGVLISEPPIAASALEGRPCF